MSLESDPRVVGIGGAAAGASIATAAVGLILPTVSLLVPAIGAVVALAALALTGALQRPEKVLYDPGEHLLRDS